jgi:MFS family permease
VLAICRASIVVVVMDISIVNVALPVIRSDLHASLSGLQWTVDVCTLVLASFLVPAGSMADRVGRHRVFQIGLATFGLGSLLCALAPSIGWLIAARALQAVGGTMLNPVAMAIIVNTFSDSAERARAIGVFGSMTGFSPALGPILGGALVDGFGWSAIFWINVPIAAVAIVCAALFVHSDQLVDAGKDRSRLAPAAPASTHQAGACLAVGSTVPDSRGQRGDRHAAVPSARYQPVTAARLHQ